MDEQELREAVAELVDDWYTGEVASRVSVAPDARDDLKERIAGFVRGEQAEIERLRVENERLRAEHDDLAQWLNIFQNIALERRRQDAKWGEQNHDAFLWLAILGEEFGETAKAAIEGRLADMRTELIHVAAVAVAAIESLNRNELVEHRATHDVFKRSAYRVLELRSL